jgi:hypothetical protein
MLGPIPLSQIDTNTANRVDVRVTKTVRLNGNRRVELVAQVFNVFGHDNLLSVGDTWQENALSSSFGRITTTNPRQQGELAVHVVF